MERPLKNRPRLSKKAGLSRNHGDAPTEKRGLRPGETARVGNSGASHPVTPGMNTTVTLAIRGAALPRPNSSLRPLKTTLLVLALLAGVGAITVTAAASALSEEGGGMAGYA